MIGKPPLEAGAVQLTVACESPKVAALLRGSEGFVVGTTPWLATDACPLPTALVAVTVKV